MLSTAIFCSEIETKSLTWSERNSKSIWQVSSSVKSCDRETLGSAGELDISGELKVRVWIKNYEISNKSRTIFSSNVTWMEILPDSYVVTGTLWPFEVSPSHWSILNEHYPSETYYWKDKGSNIFSIIDSIKYLRLPRMVYWLLLSYHLFFDESGETCWEASTCTIVMHSWDGYSGLQTSSSGRNYSCCKYNRHGSCHCSYIKCYAWFFFNNRQWFIFKRAFLGIIMVQRAIWLFKTVCIFMLANVWTLL